MSSHPSVATVTEAPLETDRIRLSELTFPGRHGWYDAERQRDRPFTVDLTVGLDLSRPSRSDALTDTLDYNELAESVRRVVTGQSHRLIERLAGAVAEAVLADHPVLEVEVTVHKPTPGVAGEPSAASVTIRRKRL